MNSEINTLARNIIKDISLFDIEKQRSLFMWIFDNADVKELRSDLLANSASMKAALELRDDFTKTSKNKRPHIKAISTEEASKIYYDCTTKIRDEKINKIIS
jgi:hypothetical protein